MGELWLPEMSILNANWGLESVLDVDDAALNIVVAGEATEGHGLVHNWSGSAEAPNTELALK